MFKLRLGFTLACLAGIAVAIVLTVHAGFADVVAAVRAVGWAGLALVCLLQLISLLLCALAWNILSENTKFSSCFFARWIRDGASNLIGPVPGIGDVIGARTLTIGGLGAGLAAATTVVDVAVESLSQALYTLVGLVPLLVKVQNGETAWVAASLVAIVPILATWLIIQHPPALALAERLLSRAAKPFGMSEGVAKLRIGHTVGDLFRNRRRIGLSFVVHLAAWMVGAVQVWAAAQAMGHPIGLATALALESLVYAARTAFFVVPWAAGVQEGSFVLVGAALGLDAATAIALSLILRARDVFLGLPALLLWSLAEGRHKWLRRAPDLTS